MNGYCPLCQSWGNVHDPDRHRTKPMTVPIRLFRIQVESFNPGGLWEVIVYARGLTEAEVLADEHVRGVLNPSRTRILADRTVEVQPDLPRAVAIEEVTL